MFLRKKNKNQQRYNNYYQGIPLVIPQAPTPAPQPIRPQKVRPQVPTIPNIPRRPQARSIYQELQTRYKVINFYNKD
ncbi:hypothetical protein F8M41_013007 [Gigaspora margarita]|uniref:Uncharacterized protein n=1 Tax=Gigaspora margarita TaxID=4874 RepID=A0A8H4EP76_GIGMA|nr:hypothetical protein F8M41_013007 [Gigaspora margarita]